MEAKTQKTQRLDKFETEYFWRTQKRAAECEEEERIAQQNHNGAMIAAQGFASALKEKYDLADDDRIEPDGQIVRTKLESSAKKKKE